jgi:hypothetical protein
MSNQHPAPDAIMQLAGLQPRGATDWLDALVSLGMLERDSDLYVRMAGLDRPHHPGAQAPGRAGRGRQ